MMDPINPDAPEFADAVAAYHAWQEATFVPSPPMLSPEQFAAMTPAEAMVTLSPPSVATFHSFLRATTLAATEHGIDKRDLASAIEAKHAATYIARRQAS